MLQAVERMNSVYKTIQHIQVTMINFVGHIRRQCNFIQE